MMRSTTASAALLLGLFLEPLLAAGGVPVVDRTDQAKPVSQTATTAPVTAVNPRAIGSSASAKPPAAKPATAPNAMVELLMMLDQLQEEVSFLRGQFEQQQYQLKRLQTDQRDRYRDLDRRLSLLNEQLLARPAATDFPVASQAAVSSALSAAGGSPSIDTTGAGRSPANAPVISAAQAYKQAFGLVRERQFSEALQAFEHFLRQYPDSPLRPNVLYWSGEVYRVKPNPDLAKAGSAYQQVVEGYPEHAKTADAYYKLGLSYQGMGQVDKAKASMTRLIALFPEQPAAVLAQDFLKQHP